MKQHQKVKNDNQPKLKKPIPRIAIQGFKGSFHQFAAIKYFGKNIEILPGTTFRDVILLTSDTSKCDAGVMAIENSIAGSILPNYQLLEKSHLKIVGEIYLKIEHNLLVNPGVQLKEIREVHSHPMALLQCLPFLEKYNWKLVETQDTAYSAKKVSEKSSHKIAAIASSLSAELFNLKIIKKNIHSQKNNYTRFLILQKEPDFQNHSASNKASISFWLPHRKGSLARLLTKMSQGGLNLSKLQSVSIPESHFLYSFHADVEFDHIKQFESTMKKIIPLTTHFRIYGIYQKGKRSIL